MNPVSRLSVLVPALIALVDGQRKALSNYSENVRALETQIVAQLETNEATKAALATANAALIEAMANDAADAQAIADAKLAAGEADNKIANLETIAVNASEEAGRAIAAAETSRGELAALESDVAANSDELANLVKMIEATGVGAETEAVAAETTEAI